MTLATSLLTLLALTPAPQGNDLKLPVREAQQEPLDVPRPLTEVERFRRDVDDLGSTPSRTEQKLQEIGLRYPAIEQLVIEVARAARSRELAELMPVAKRYGTARVAQELRFQLLARPLGGATRAVVDAMAFLMGPDRDARNELDERQALRDVIRGRQSAARRAAVDVLAGMANADDLPFALDLTSAQSLDLQLCGVDLLAAIDDPAARQRLVKLLSKAPALAGGACAALIGLREAAQPELEAVLAEPAIDRGYAYAAFALAEIGEALGRSLLDPALAAGLGKRLRDREPLTRCLAAVALADIAYYAAPAAAPDPAAGSTAVIDDVAIGDVLLELVDSRTFVPNLDLLRRPAERRLVRMTGRVVEADAALSWREWWQARRSGFVGIRAAVAVDAANAASAVVTLRTGHETIRLLGEQLLDVAPLADSFEAFLPAPAMLALVQDLERDGFSDPELVRNPSGLPLARSVEIRVGGARAFVAVPAAGQPAFDVLAQRIERGVEQQLWQLYRHPQNEPDRAAFWRAERRWLESHEDPLERGRRFGRRVISTWPALSQRLRARALEHLFARGDRAGLFDENDGDGMLALVRAAPELGELELRLLELAAGIPGDRIWRECVDVAARAPGGGRDAVRSVFAVLGPDAVLAALGDERAVVRRVAIDEAVVTRDLRAGPRLVELLQDGEQPDEVRRAAAHAVGQLHLTIASEPLVALIVAPETVPLVRRECLVALGRTGGAQAFGVLDRALRAPVPEDREAALRGLGELRDPRAAHTLAELAVIANGKDLGSLAMLYLGRMGASLAVPAIRHQAQIQQDPAIHDELVLLLGGYQDPEAIPELMQLLRTPRHEADARVALMGTTGIDLGAAEDPWTVVDEWWRANRNKPQWQWLLDGLARADAATLLRPEHFGPSVEKEAIPELARLLTELDQPYLFVLASAVLRTVAREDFGVVSMQTSREARNGIAARYRVLYETSKAAQNR